MRPSRSAIKRWARERLVGVQNCLIPSFDPATSRLDEPAIRHDVAQSIRHGFVATLCIAEAGLTPDEAMQFVSIVADAAGEQLLVSTTVMLDTMEQNLALLRHADRAGCHFAFVDFPHGWQPRDEDELHAAIRRLCDASDLGIFLHPVPRDNLRRLHPAGFSPRLLDRLADLDTVVAAEITDPGLFAEALRTCGDRLVLQCPLERFAPLLVERCGLQLLGPGAYELYQSPGQPLLVDAFAMLRAGDHDGAMALYWRLAPVRMTFEMKMMQMMPIGGHPLPLWKYYQWLAGGNGGYSATRLPIMELGEMDRMMARQARAMSGLEQPPPDDAGFFVGRVHAQPSDRAARPTFSTSAKGPG